MQYAPTVPVIAGLTRNPLIITMVFVGAGFACPDNEGEP